MRELRAAFSMPSANDVEEFEAAFAKSLDVPYALAFPYGRTGLILLLEALGLKDREVIVPAYTCVVVPHAIVYSGNKPVFVDSQEYDFNMDLSLAEKSITSSSGAIIATSIFGYPCNLDELETITKRSKYRLPVIQDCAHSFGACWKGQYVHRAGIAAIFGLNIGKLITSIFGGMVTTDDRELYDRLKALRSAQITPGDWLKSFARIAYILSIYPAFSGLFYGMTNWFERSGILGRLTRYYDENSIDMPSDYLQGMVPVEARFGRENLKRYEMILSARREAAEYYFQNLQMPAFCLPPRVEGATYSHFAVRVPDRSLVVKRCLGHGLQLGELIEYNIPEMKAYGSHDPAEFPVSAALSRHTINLPVWGGSRLAKVATERLRAAMDS